MWFLIHQRVCFCDILVETAGSSLKSTEPSYFSDVFRLVSVSFKWVNFCSLSSGFHRVGWFIWLREVFLQVRDVHWWSVHISRKHKHWPPECSGSARENSKPMANVCVCVVESAELSRKTICTVFYSVCSVQALWGFLWSACLTGFFCKSCALILTQWVWISSLQFNSFIWNEGDLCVVSRFMHSAL